MDAGKLTVQITIQTNTPVQDAELNWVDSWADWKTVWAQPLEQTGRELYRMQSTNNEISGGYRIRYLAGVTPRMRIKAGARGIVSVINENERNESLLIAYKAVV